MTDKEKFIAALREVVEKIQESIGTKPQTLADAWVREFADITDEMVKELVGTSQRIGGMAQLIGEEAKLGDFLAFAMVAWFTAGRLYPARERQVGSA